MPLLAAFFLFVFLELFLLFSLAFGHGWGWNVFILEAGTAIIGVMLIRRQRDFTLREVVQGPRDFFSMQRSVLTSAWVASAGVLLIIPGLITDFAGVLVLGIPLLRRALKALRRGPPPPRDPPSGSTGGGGGGRIIEGEVVPPDERK